MHRRLLRILRLDASDDHLFPRAAVADKWAVPGGVCFTLGDDDPDSLDGAAARAFTSGFLGVESFGWATLAVVSDITSADWQRVEDRLTQQLMVRFGAPSDAAARAQAVAELCYTGELCTQPPNTVLSLQRRCTDDGIEETLRLHKALPTWQRAPRVFSAQSTVGRTAAIDAAHPFQE